MVTEVEIELHAIGCREGEQISKRRSPDVNAARPGDSEQMGSGAATVISIGRVLSRTYQGPLARDGW
jgi:hypothetical protein